MRWRPGVVATLLALVALPLGVLALRLDGDLRRTELERASASEIVPITELRLRTIELGAALSDERTWSIATLGVEQFGVDPVVAKDILGIDIVQEYEDARKATDSYLEGFEALRRDVDAIRTDRRTNLQIAAGYQSITSRVEQLGLEAARDLEAEVVSREAEDLLRELAVAETAAKAQVAVNGQFVSSIAARFVESTGQPEVELRSLVGYREAYDDATVQLDGLAQSDVVRRELVLVTHSEAQRKLLADVDVQIDRALRSGLDPDEGELFSAATANLDELHEFLISAEEANAQWIALIEIAGEQLVASADDLAADAASDAARTRALLLLTGLVTLAATVVVAVLLSRSVRRLAQSAQALRDGGMPASKPAGPREVKLAGQALGEAASNFELVRSQAGALAEGNLDHPDLEQTAPGQLGSTLKQVVDTLAVSIHAQRRAQETADWQAWHDGLTGLPNRSAAVRQLTSLLVEQRVFDLALMIVDLDGFKDINDGHGHPAGDEVLVSIAERLRSGSHAEQQVFRLGGDEFVVVATGVTTTAQVRQVARNILRRLARPIVLDNGTPVTVRASVGVALAEPDLTGSEMLKRADIAVYEAKSSGRNRVVVCTTELLDANERVIRTASELADAIEQNHLRLEYQPVVDGNGLIIGLEALVRWEHEVHGTIAPASFIGVAERSDLVVELDRWVLRAVAAQLETWSSPDEPLGDIPVAVNLSTRHLNAPTLVDDVVGPLTEASVDPARLTIEVTETALLEGADQARRNLTRLRAEGVKIAIDDFGTGYSAITQLRMFPVDCIKIDRTFTAHVTDTSSYDRALMRMIIDLGHVIGATIITEGIESEEQAREVMAMGSDAMQGWYFSPSVRPEHVGALLGQLPWEAFSPAER